MVITMMGMMMPMIIGKMPWINVAQKGDTVVATEKMEELDKATDTMNLMHEIDIYVLLQKIKYADERDAVIDEALKVSRFKLENVWKLVQNKLNFYYIF